MKITVIEGTSLADLWYRALYAAVDEGQRFKIDRGSYAGQERLELDFVVAHAKYPGTRPLAPAMPEGSPIPPPFDEDYLADYLPYLMTAVLKPGESYTYGQRLAGAPIDPKTAAERFDRTEIYTELADWAAPMVVERRQYEFVLSQIDLLIHTYKKYGHRTNQMILQVAQPTDMLLRDPPCLRHIDTRIQDGKLHFFPYFRSWDLYGGFPANLAAIELLLEHCAGEIGVEPGEILASSKGLHLYDHIWPLAESLRGHAIAAAQEPR